MSALPSRLKSLRVNAGLTQEEFGKIFGLVKSTVSLYESGKSTPSDDIKMKICKYFDVSIDYLLGLDGVESAEDVFDYHGGDENAVTFQQKLIAQLSYADIGLHPLSVYLDLPEDTLIEWLNPESNNKSYENYYKELSKFFSTTERYWISPRAISPGIEPDIDEYMLLLKRRDYLASGEIYTYYKSFDDFFPGLLILSDAEEIDVIKSYRELERDRKDIIKGKLKEALIEQRKEESQEDAMELPKASGKY